jgi:hypothetical protein
MENENASVLVTRSRVTHDHSGSERPGTACNVVTGGNVDVHGIMAQTPQDIFERRAI